MDNVPSMVIPELNQSWRWENGFVLMEAVICAPAGLACKHFYLGWKPPENSLTSEEVVLPFVKKFVLLAADATIREKFWALMFKSLLKSKLPYMGTWISCSLHVNKSSSTSAKKSLNLS